MMNEMKDSWLFYMTDLNELRFFLGISIEKDMSLNETSFLRNVLKNLE